jgi:hypothetical protein
MFAKKSRLLQNNTQRISKIGEIFFEQIILEDKSDEFVPVHTELQKRRPFKKFSSELINNHSWSM